MQREGEHGYHGDSIDQTSAWPIPYGHETEHFERQARKYLLQTQHQVTTEATEIPMSGDATSALFEYELSGLRVKALGQATGGYVKEVAENEAAFSYSLQDPVSLYVLKKIASSEVPVTVNDLDDVVKEGKGWMRVAVLLRGGLLDLVGSELRATERGHRELDAILTYCRLQRS